MRALLTIVSLLVPSLVWAQPYSAAPLIVDTNAKPAAAHAEAAPSFPETAVTRIGAVTSGAALDQPADAPKAPDAPLAPTPPDAAALATPASPPSPISKLWPRDTVPIFLRSCTGYHPELVAACSCVITQLMSQMPHDEFLRLSENNAIDQDARYTAIRQQCVATPQRKD